MAEPNAVFNGGRPILLAHRADLGRSGVSPATAAAAGLYSETDPVAVAKLLNWGKPAGDLGPALVFPYLDDSGDPTGYVRLKPTNPRRDKSAAGKVIKYEAPKGQPNRAYVPPGSRAVLADPAIPLIATEGEKKALAADAAGFACVGLPGVWSWQRKRVRDERGKGVGPRLLIPDLAAVAWPGRTVFLVFDSDAATNPNVRTAERALAAALTAAGAVVRVVRLPAGPDGRKQGLDDFLVARGPDAMRELLAGPPADAAPPSADVPLILIGPDEHRVNAEAVAALAVEPDLYQRAGILVQVTEAPPDPPAGARVRRPAGAPVVRELPPPLLRDRLTRCARWFREATRNGETAESPVHPPVWCVAAVHAHGHWPGVRPLEAVVTHPVLLGNGTLLTASGYDPDSKLLVCAPPDLSVSVTPRPTQADARAAVKVLLAVVADFPFAADVHKAAWLAGLLTPLAWFAFDGPAPLFLIDANVRAAGKGLLADVVALVVTGRRFSVMAYTADRDELRKRITTLAVEGERLVLLDNLAGAVGNDVLDAALTSDWWKERLLGTNRRYEGPLHVSWYATGNNVQLAADTARRVCHVRLESAEERPELRAGFRHRDLRAHVREHRGRLLSAALTILRAWVIAGRPTFGLPPWGSYEGWSAVVREAVVFAGLPDPGETRTALQTAADRDAGALAALMAAMEHLDLARQGLTASELVEKAKGATGGGPAAELRIAVEELCGKLDSRALGYRLKHFARRNVGGRLIDRAGADRTHAMRWVVMPAAANRPACSPASPSSPSSGAGGAGDAGDEGEPAARRPGRLWDDYADQRLPD